MDVIAAREAVAEAEELISHGLLCVTREGGGIGEPRWLFLQPPLILSAANEVLRLLEVNPSLVEGTERMGFRRQVVSALPYASFLNSAIRKGEVLTDRPVLVEIDRDTVLGREAPLAGESMGTYTGAGVCVDTEDEAGDWEEARVPSHV